MRSCLVNLNDYFVIFLCRNWSWIDVLKTLLPVAVFSENWSTSTSGFNCSTSSCSSLITGWSNYNKLHSFSWSLETADCSCRYSELPSKKSAMNTSEVAVTFVLFFRSLLKRHHFVSIASFFKKGSNTRKIKTKSKFRIGRSHVYISHTKPCPFLNWTCLSLLPAFFNSAMQV
jgi:hypothetical protein